MAAGCRWRASPCGSWAALHRGHGLAEGNRQEKWWLKTSGCSCSSPAVMLPMIVVEWPPAVTSSRSVANSVCKIRFQKINATSNIIRVQLYTNYPGAEFIDAAH